MAFEYSWNDQVWDTMSGEGTTAGRARREAEWRRRNPGASAAASRVAAAAPVAVRSAESQFVGDEAKEYSNWLKTGLTEEQARDTVINKRKAARAAQAGPLTVVNPALTAQPAPAPAPAPTLAAAVKAEIDPAKARQEAEYQASLGLLQQARQRSAVNPYARTNQTVADAMRADQAALAQRAAARRAQANLGGQTSAGRAAMRAALTGSEALGQEGISRQYIDQEQRGAIETRQAQDRIDQAELALRANPAGGLRDALSIAQMTSGALGADRGYGEDVRRYDQGFGYRQGRDAIEDAFRERGLREDTRRYSEGFEYKKAQDILQRQDLKDSEKIALIGSLIGAVGGVAGQAIGRR